MRNVEVRLRGPHIVTLEMVREIVEEIAAVSRDPEVAHLMEDELHQCVLAAIAEGRYASGDAARLAKAALETRCITYGRWYA